MPDDLCQKSMLICVISDIFQVVYTPKNPLSNKHFDRTLVNLGVQIQEGGVVSAIFTDQNSPFQPENQPINQLNLVSNNLIFFKN